MPFGIVGLTSPKIAQGMDYWRILVPLLHMRSLAYPVIVTRMGNDLPTWDGEPPKVLVLSEPFAATHGKDRKTKALCRKLGILYVVDIADDPTPTGDGPLKRGEAAWGWKLECIAEADLVTCPSDPLADILRQWNPHVAVLPDLAEAAHWGEPPPKDRPDALTVGVRGGGTHQKDWAILEEPWRRLAEECPDLHFVSAGLEVEWMKQLPSERYHHLGWTLIDDYQEKCKWIDIGCAPLDGAHFNRSKSPIAFMDYSLAQAVTIASSDSIYEAPIRESMAGFLSDPESWYYLLRYIVDLPGEDRTALALNAKAWVIENKCMNQWHALNRYNTYHHHWERVYEWEATNERYAVLHEPSGAASPL